MSLAKTLVLTGSVAVASGALGWLAFNYVAFTEQIVRLIMM